MARQSGYADFFGFSDRIAYRALICRLSTLRLAEPNENVF
jgi:hypothetical protein